MVTDHTMNITLGRVSSLLIRELCDVTQASWSTTTSSWNDY